MNSFTRVNLASTGFTGTNVWNESVEDIFKGASKAESFLHITVTSNDSEWLILSVHHIHFIHVCLLFSSDSNTLLAENWFFPSNFSDVDLPKANITTTKFQPSSNKVMVCLFFCPHRKIETRHYIFVTL